MGLINGEIRVASFEVLINLRTKHILRFVDMSSHQMRDNIMLEHQFYSKFKLVGFGPIIYVIQSHTFFRLFSPLFLGNLGACALWQFWRGFIWVSWFG